MIESLRLCLILSIEGPLDHLVQVANNPAYTILSSVCSRAQCRVRAKHTKHTCPLNPQARSSRPCLSTRYCEKGEVVTELGAKIDSMPAVPRGRLGRDTNRHSEIGAYTR